MSPSSLCDVLHVHTRNPFSASLRFDCARQRFLGAGHFGRSRPIPVVADKVPRPVMRPSSASEWRLCSPVLPLLRSEAAATELGLLRPWTGAKPAASAHFEVCQTDQRGVRVSCGGHSFHPRPSLPCTPLTGTTPRFLAMTTCHAFVMPARWQRPRRSAPTRWRWSCADCWATSCGCRWQACASTCKTSYPARRWWRTVRQPRLQTWSQCDPCWPPRRLTPRTTLPCCRQALAPWRQCV